MDLPCLATMVWSDQEPETVIVLDVAISRHSKMATFITKNSSYLHSEPMYNEEDNAGIKDLRPFKWPE